MVAVLAPLDKTRQYSPVWLRAVFTSPRGLARRQYRRLPFHKLSPLYPESQMREATLKFAKQFIADMESQGYQLLTNEADLLVTGPLRARGWDKATDGTYKRKHHVTGKPVDLFPVVGRSASSEPYPDKEDFILEARFLNTRVRMVEYRVKEPADG